MRLDDVNTNRPASSTGMRSQAAFGDRFDVGAIWVAAFVNASFVATNLEDAFGEALGCSCPYAD